MVDSPTFDQLFKRFNVIRKKFPTLSHGYSTKDTNEFGLMVFSPVSSMLPCDSLCQNQLPHRHMGVASVQVESNWEPFNFLSFGAIPLCLRPFYCREMEWMGIEEKEVEEEKRFEN